MSILISIVIPTHNEQANIAPLCDRIARVFVPLSEYDWELIFVDDSNDDTLAAIQEASNRNPRIKAIRLVRQFGQGPAIAAGLKRARGRAVVLMDADLQDPPEAIPQLLERWREGNKIVYVQRASQSSSWLYRFMARIFYRMLSSISEVDIPVDAGEFRLIDQAAVDFMNSLNERSRFIRGLTMWPGFRSAKIEIVRGERLHGETNYNLARALTVAIDGFISFSVAPLRVATIVGMAAALVAVLLACMYLALWLFDRSTFGAGWITIILLILFMGGLNLFCLGIVGEYVGRVFMELQKRPLYLVEREFGFECESHEGTDARNAKYLMPRKEDVV